ncbi:alpha/beta hydrolase family protein [Geothrix fuzhouensis]|uniref:alpha/beta hydrolase family protein n=1 Tax=Geothrix fuzhouensis TaxID=2966451 RepID=UPI00352DF9F3
MRTSLAAVLISGLGWAQTKISTTGYNQPPKAILDVMRAPSPPSPVISPSRDRLLLVAWEDYPSISRVATPYLRLAGVRIEPKNHSRHDTPGGYGIVPAALSYELVRVSDGTSIPVKLPEGGIIQAPIWSSNGLRFAFSRVTETSVELWIGDAQTGVVRPIPGVWLNQMLGGEVQWMPDQKTLLVKAVPDKLGPPPAAADVLPGPSIQESIGGKGQSSTYETRDTLGNPHDEDVFDYYSTSQLTLVDATTGVVTPVGERDHYLQARPAPDGRHLLVSTLRKPYSYVTTFERFPREVAVWDMGSRSAITKHLLASLPLADRVPIHGEPLGPRQFAWRPTEPATLIWAEALDGGDWKTKVPHRDKVMMLRAPFESAPVELFRTEQRFSGLMWGERPGLALLYEYDHNKHWTRTFIVNPDAPKQAPRKLWDLSTEEQYADPGNPVWRPLPNGAAVLRQEGEFIFLSGQGASPEGNRPFLDRLDLRTLKTERLFRSGKTEFEMFVGFTGPDSKQFLTWHQSPLDPPNAYARSLGKGIKAPAGEAAFASQRKALTHIPDPTPEVRQIKKHLVTYKRADGVDLSFTLYTPPGYREGTRVPAILYAYPLDYADPAKAGQVSGSQYTFTRLRNYRLLLLAGYAIIDNASFPIVGDPTKAYDTYLDQLVADAKAAVDKAVELGVVDPGRIGVTGHSHGALMAANLVAHSPLFKAGVATSGSYNKTLTPFGFQNERRSVWEAPEVYRQVSTFFFADKLKTPLLIMHGADDANPGTTPLQATKLYEAIRGNGGTTRLVMLPFEPHWYSARESNEQLIYEMLRWFDTYVKNPQPVATPRK